MPQNNRKRKHSSAVEKHSPKQQCKELEEQLEDEQLSKILFGGSSSFLQSLEEAERETVSESKDVDSGVGETDDSDSSSETKVKKPAWTDDDDGIDVGEALDSQSRRLPSGGINARSNRYKELLSKKFASIAGTPKWATLTSKSEESTEDEILQACGFIKKTPTTRYLPPSKLDFKMVKDVNCETYCEGPTITSVEFHPKSTVSLVAGSSGVVSLYAVDGKRNNKLHNVKFVKFPISCAKFTPDGNDAIIGSNKKYFYNYDLIASKSLKIATPAGLDQMENFIISPNGKYIAVAGLWGEIHLLHLRSRERIHLFKQDSEVTSLAFNNSGSLLYGHSITGEITIFDMTMLRIIHKFTDEGCLQGTKICVSPCNQFLATGSAQGVVNVYDLETIAKNKTPTPRKSIFNLVTSINDLRFNNTSEFLAMSSAAVNNAVKIFHVESNAVFGNFPTFSSKIGLVNVLNISPSSGYLAMGTKKSTVALYRLDHYKNY